MSQNNYPGKNAYYNGNNIAGIAGLFIGKIDVDQPPKRIAETYKIAGRDGDQIIGDPYDTKMITIEGSFACNTQAQREAARDLLMAALNDFNAVFYTDVNNLARQWQKCYLYDLSISDFAGGFANVSITIIANDPFGYDMNYQTLTNNVNFTAKPQTFSFTPGGTAKRQELLITLTLNTFTPTLATFPLITLTNPVTNEACLFVGTAVAGDVFVFDSKAGVLTQNGVAVLFTGVIPSAAPTASSIVYGDGCSARNVNVTIQNLKRWI